MTKTRMTTDEVTKIPSHCGMCVYSLPDEKSKRVFCSRNPPIPVVVHQKNPITNNIDEIVLSILPDILRGTTCGEYKPRLS